MPSSSRASVSPTRFALPDGAVSRAAAPAPSAVAEAGRAAPASQARAALVFALTVALMLSDYMSRQVLNAVFPQLKAEWALSDTELGSLAGVVGLLVGVLTVPLSIAAERWGRVRSVMAMALLWSGATLGCALATSYGQMFAARFAIGVGEAAYGSVGLALVLALFPAHLRATLTGAFMAAGPVGSVLGLALGGVVARAAGWRWSFGAMAAFGLALAIAWGAVVRAPEDGAAVPARSAHESAPRRGLAPGLGVLFGARSLVLVYVASGLQLFTLSALIAWLPSYLNRAGGWAPDRAALGAAGCVLVGALGMVACGAVTDRVARHAPGRRWTAAALFALVSAVTLLAAFSLPPGRAQVGAIALGMLLTAGASGPAGAIAASLTPPAVHATVFATMTLLNNLLGIGPGPFVAGILADRIGLGEALRIVPAAGLASAAAFALGRATYARDLARAQPDGGEAWR